MPVLPTFSVVPQMDPSRDADDRHHQQDVEDPIGGTRQSAVTDDVMRCAHPRGNHDHRLRWTVTGSCRSIRDAIGQGRKLISETVAIATVPTISSDDSRLLTGRSVLGRPPRCVQVSGGSVPGFRSPVTLTFAVAQGRCRRAVSLLQLGTPLV